MKVKKNQNNTINLSDIGNCRNNNFQKLKKTKKFSKSSQSWLRRQINDPLVQAAKDQGFRARSAFKIIEINNKFKIFKKNHLVVDLGAAPGGWSQVAVADVGFNNVIAIDLLPILPIEGIFTIEGDFLCESIKEQILNKINERQSQNKFLKCLVVMSDMAANCSGNKTVDHLRIINLLEDALQLAVSILAKDGIFVGKIFQGGSSAEILTILRQNFSKVDYFKPESSRKDSSEVYLIARGFRKIEV
jgi:23S rRNA (uridine2552-2'-O)-methyltransferase